jgi:hypothetical protein
MKRIIVSLFVFTGLSALAVAADTHSRGCSNTSLRGAYGFQTGGIIVPAGTPRGNLGRYVFDGAGNFTNTLTVNDNGTIIPVTDAGTYTVNADCTGTISPDSGGSVDIVLVDGGKEFHLLRTDPPNWVMLFSVAKQQFPADDEH